MIYLDTAEVDRVARDYVRRVEAGEPTKEISRDPANGVYLSITNPALMSAIGKVWGEQIAAEYRKRCPVT